MGKKSSYIEIVPEKPIYGGKCLGEYEGKKVILERALPGEKVVAKVKKRRKNYLECVATEIIEKSDKRVEHGCNYYPSCGGCKLLDVDYNYQLEIKSTVVKDCIERLGKVKDYTYHNILASPKSDRYRNKMEFTFSNHQYYIGDREYDDSDDFFLGFHAPKVYSKVIDIDTCLLHSKRVDSLFRSIKRICKESGLKAYDIMEHTGFFRYLVFRETVSGEVMINLVTKRYEREIVEDIAKKVIDENPFVVSFVNTINSGLSSTAYGEASYLISGKEKVIDSIGNLKFEISVNSFFQVNPFQTGNLYNKAFELGRFSKNDTIIDLYCGVGTISLFAASYVKEVIGFELVENAVKDALRNMKLNNLTNCDFFSGDLMKVVGERSIFTERKYDAIITDPPRDGMHPKVVKSIVESKIKKIVYISCNPSTFARDVELLEIGGYKLKEAIAVDMFPNTYHVETIGVLELVSKKEEQINRSC
ncbi:MAG: 23S rRNA (uracil(1939)-C(5))-methyltransferase RlmD [Candidatus Cloacimonadota bacterium]|nr:MAG: 23S rRNA (uracil(1939)-C(5))-methyltransferase RlmD [Candidatus Cloacimonadota bacterium]PIE79937.1 MAG: 23S rRNA (uracil(1939)-C(5))-methyltransferase RlmD [Candidatus Delongbacteria bacterium]